MLTQNSGGRQAEILQLIRRFCDEAVRDASASRACSRLPAREAWERLVREVEWKLAEMPLPKLQRERVPLAAVQGDLRELQDGCCFYCARALGARCEVDHFVSWARTPDNGIENLIVVDRGCNGAKRDRLAAAEHVDVWARRVEWHESDLATIATRAQWDRHPDRTLAVARSISLRLPDEERLWRLAQEFVTVDRPRLVRVFEGWPGAR